MRRTTAVLLATLCLTGWVQHFLDLVMYESQSSQLLTENTTVDWYSQWPSDNYIPHRTNGYCGHRYTFANLRLGSKYETTTPPTSISMRCSGNVVSNLNNGRDDFPTRARLGCMLIVLPDDLLSRWRRSNRRMNRQDSQLLTRHCSIKCPFQWYSHTAMFASAGNFAEIATNSSVMHHYSSEEKSLHISMRLDWKHRWARGRSMTDSETCSQSKILTKESLTRRCRLFEHTNS